MLPQGHGPVFGVSHSRRCHMPAPVPFVPPCLGEHVCVIFFVSSTLDLVEWRGISYLSMTSITPTSKVKLKNLDFPFSHTNEPFKIFLELFGISIGPSPFILTWKPHTRSPHLTRLRDGHWRIYMDCASIVSYNLSRFIVQFYFCEFDFYKLET
jgi:hypothetical protein